MESFENYSNDASPQKEKNFPGEVDNCLNSSSQHKHNVNEQNLDNTLIQKQNFNDSNNLSTTSKTTTTNTNNGELKNEARSDGKLVNHKKNLATNQNESKYVPRWRSSVNDNSNEYNLVQEDEHQSDSGDEFIPFDDDVLPSFADDECNAINEEIRLLEKRRDNIEKKTKDHVERVEIMSDHLRKVQQEIDYTNDLVAAKKQEIKSEKHILSISARNKDHYVREANQIGDAIMIERTRFKSLQGGISNVNFEMNSFKQAMNWNQEELEKWSSEATKREDDNIVLEKYTRADEAKIKELTLAIERLSKSLVKKNAQLDNEMTNTQSYQLEVKRSVDIFKGQHEERQRLVKQWQSTIENMRLRDKEINTVSMKFLKVKKDFVGQLDMLTTSRQKNEVMKTDIHEMQQTIVSIESLVQLKRQENVVATADQKSFQNELDILRYENMTSSVSLLKKNNKHSASVSKLRERTDSLKKMQEQVEATKSKLTQEKKSKVTQEEAVKELEDLLMHHEKELKKAENNIQGLNDQMFKESQNLAELRRVESNLITDIKSSQKVAKSLTSKYQNLESERMDQHELIYNAEFQKQQMERKIARGLGLRSDVELKQLRHRISELEGEGALQKIKRKDVTQQCRKVQHELRIWSRMKEKCEIQMENIQNKIKDIELEIVSCEVTLQKLTDEKENAMVSLDVMRLDVRRLRDSLKQKTSEVLALKMRREKLIFSISEKKEEINVHSELKIAQLRVSEEERHKNAIELAQRRLVVEKLKAKHEMLRKSYHPEVDGAEGEHSQVYYLIKAAQKKEELQREGDFLDQKIRTKEKEIRAMEKELSKLRNRNTGFRLSFSKADHTSKEMQNVILLENEIRSHQESLFKKKNELLLLERDVHYNKSQFDELKNKTKELEIQSEHLVDAKQHAVNELIQRNNFEEEYAKNLKEIIVQYRKKLNLSPTKKSLQEQEFCAQVINSNKEALFQTLVELSKEFPEIANSIEIGASKVGLSTKI